MASLRPKLEWGVADQPAGAGGADPDVPAYVGAYLFTRSLAGAMGLALPFVLLIGEWLFLSGSIKARGSLSTYYHSPMRDWFVGFLFVIGIVLLTHMIGQWNFEFAASAVGGAGVIGLALVPTGRSDPLPGSCGTHPYPADCAPLENAWGESTCAHIHYACTGVFLVALVLLSVYFALGERKLGHRRQEIVHAACASVMLLMLAIIGAGALGWLRFGPLSALYVGELGTILAFGSSWLVKGAGIRQVLAGRAPGPGN